MDDALLGKTGHVVDSLVGASAIDAQQKLLLQISDQPVGQTEGNSGIHTNGEKLSIDERLLKMLRCPIDGTTLAIADAALVERLNQSIASGELRDQVDQKIAEPIDGALVTTDGERAYLIRGGIPTLIADESVNL